MRQTKRYLLCLMCLGIFLCLRVNLVLAQSAQEIAKKAFGSTVLLVMEDAEGQPLSLGSGFFVGQGEIATNLHVIEGASSGYAKLVGMKMKYEISGFTSIDMERDLVVLKISQSSMKALSLGNSDSVQVGDSVYAVGNPQGLEGTFSQGIVSSVRAFGDEKLLQITAPISPGSSGGPVLNEKGEVIGVSVATFSGGQNLNFAIPACYLKALLGKQGSIKPMVQAKPIKAQNSIIANLGGKSSEGVVGEHMYWDSIKDYNGYYSFSIVNQLRTNVKNIYCVVIFRNILNRPIDIDVVRYEGLVPAGLAKRVNSNVDASVQKLAVKVGAFGMLPNVEFRILDFEIVD